MVEYTDEYVEQCFQIWYSLQRPNLEKLYESIPLDANGRKPTKQHLITLRNEYGWNERADALSAMAIQKAETLLIDKQADMFKRQAEDAFEIATMAKDHLIANGFDTASSAVNALKWATEEERTVRGAAEFLIKVSKMSQSDLEARATKLLRRQNEAVDADVTEVDDNADQRSEAT